MVRESLVRVMDIAACLEEAVLVRQPAWLGRHSHSQLVGVLAVEVAAGAADDDVVVGNVENVGNGTAAAAVAFAVVVVAAAVG